MCGITCIWHLDGQPMTANAVGDFTRMLSHRGPDGEGIYVDRDANLGLGHRRLAILDLTDSGRQPLSYANERWWITFNGEIYNFLELRAELVGLGHVFHSQTDTEVVLAAYVQWGADCQLRFNGMWAFAIWDRQERALFVSRDRFGIKPLLYVARPDLFALASELKAFLNLPGFIPRENEMAVRSTLVDVSQMEGTEVTLLAGVKRLQGGHCMLVRSGKTSVQRWWNTLDHLVQAPAGLEAQAGQFRQLFIDSCRLRLRSDVAVGTCLSGGLDSSAILCTLARIDQAFPDGRSDRRTENWRHAFVATFPGTSLDERSYAESAVDYAGATPHYMPISATTALEDIEQIIYDFEDISCTLPTPVWANYREMRRAGVVVSLDGHGADEMLGGYGTYPQMAMRSLGWVRDPGRMLDLMNTWQDMYVKGGPVGRPSRPRLALANDPLIRVPGLVGRSIYRKWLRPLAALIRPSSRDLLIEPWLLSATPNGGPKMDAAEESAIDSLGPLNAHLYRDFHRTVLPSILRNFDRCSMAHGIEVRMPFMDWRLVAFAFSLPEQSKIGGGFAKRVLREAMRGMMPEELRTRKSKIGFNSPLPEWFNGPLKAWVLDMVNRSDFLQSETWKGELIRGFVQAKFRQGHWTWLECQRVWPFLHAQAWRQVFLERGSIARTANRSPIGAEGQDI